jgi:hypothetical protein
MNSYMFRSNACRHCSEKRGLTAGLTVLRMPTEDICCSCGEVLQRFPAITSICADPDVIMIPAEVSETLSRLLKRRLFFVDYWSVQPFRVREQNPIFNDSKQPRHRVGNQVYVNLHGAGNSWVEIRWSYSLKNLLPRYPWEELHRDEKGDYKPRPELKPDLSQMEFLVLPRVTRGIQALDGFHLTQGFRSKNDRTLRVLRYERRYDISERRLDTTDELVLVVKAEFSWLQVGSAFPDETGEARYALENRHEDRPGMPLEVAVDRIVSTAISSGETFPKSTIWDKRFSGRQVAKAENPLSGCYHYQRGEGHRSHNYNLSHRSYLEMRSDHGTAYRGAFRNESGEYLAPGGYEHYHIAITTRSISEHNKDTHTFKVNPLTVEVLKNKTVVLTKTFDSTTSSWGNNQSTLIVTLKSDAQWMPECGQEMTLRITQDGATEEKRFVFVSMAEYVRAWDNFEAPIIDAYKRTLCAAILGANRAWDLGRRDEAPAELKSGDAVAAFIGTEWFEGTFHGRSKDCRPIVQVATPGGTNLFEVVQAKPLVEALEEGLTVMPPFDPSVVVGIQAAIHTDRSAPEVEAPKAA